MLLFFIPQGKDEVQKNLASLTLLLVYYLSQRVTGEFHWEHCQYVTVSCLILSAQSRSSSSEDLRPATLFHKDIAVHSQTPVTRNPTSHSDRL